MTETNPEKSKWYFSKKTFVVGLLVIGPFALPLLWFNPKYSVTSKVLWTVITVGITVALGAFTGWLFKILMAQLGFPQ